MEVRLWHEFGPLCNVIVEVLKSVQLGGQRNVIVMRIKGIRYGDSGGCGVYFVQLEGDLGK